ncbi:MAG: hypothetical protein ACI4N0_00940 [Christensenellales bacterium]
MKPKRLAVRLLVAVTLLSLQSTALANAAEPPSFTVIVSNPPDGLELSIPSDAPGSEPYVLRKTVRGWESYYQYFYGRDPDRGSRKDELTVKYGDTRFTVPIVPDIGKYNALYTLDVTSRTIAEGEKPLRTPLLIAMRLLFTLAIEGLVFYLFGYREKKSWQVFFITNIITQTGLNLLFHGISLGYMWAIFYYPLEMFITAMEAKVYCDFVPEKSKKRSILCAIVANILSMLCGGYIIGHLPI